jgi:alanine-synthesizing transaminase
VLEGLEFFEKVVAFAREHKIIVIHDFAYADLTFDGYRAPSLLQVPGAKEVGVEFFSMTKSYSMAGWRVGFCVGNRELVGALVKIKSYLDYGMFQPIQIASIVALRGPQDCVKEHVSVYRSRRNVLVNGLNRAGWEVAKPKATMFVWARIPEAFRKMGSLEFSKFLIREGKVAVSPGVGFGEGGDEHEIRPRGERAPDETGSEGDQESPGEGAALEPGFRQKLVDFEVQKSL